ncbi:MAG TPA: hypothetical protein VKY33_06525 [Flavobacterium sp.]|nr:hypothetical protein [Flavobacterium sp.]
MKKVTLILYRLLNGKIIGLKHELPTLATEPIKMLKVNELIDNPKKLNWLISKRKVISFTEDGVYLGDFFISYNEISVQKVYSYSSFLGLLKYKTIGLVYGKDFYYVGIQNSKVLSKLIGDCERQYNKNSYSSVIVVVSGALLYMIYNYFPI